MAERVSLKRQSKYRAVPTVVDGIRFASKAEARRYAELRLLEKAGHIRKIECQPRFKLTIHNQPICTYVADFRYEEKSQVNGTWWWRVEDVKGVKTPVYKLKAKLMKALHGIEIREIQA